MLRHCCSHSSFSVAVAEPIALKAAAHQEALVAAHQEARVAARQEALQMPQRLPL